MVKRISITGPESTGKSTLSRALAERLETVWVPEFAREYLESIGRPYQEKDLLQIAKGQLALEDKFMKEANNFLICDTDLLVVKIWSEHKYGRCHPWILEKLNERKYDLFILTYIDIPWEDDPLRENPDLREYFYEKYKQELISRKFNFIEATGNLDKRISVTLKAIQALD